MTDRKSARRISSSRPARRAANDDPPQGSPREAELPPPGPPANDNRLHDNLPACLAVTDEEVMLLHRYLGGQILALFG